MIIVWRGWGGLAIGFPALGAILFLALLSSLRASSSSLGTGAGAGVALGSIGTFLFGRWINGSDRAQARAATMLEPRRHQLGQLVASGQFHLAPGMPLPRSHDEARAQADYVYQQELHQLSEQLTGRHTMFFIPMQFIGILTFAVGVMIMVTQLG